MTYAQFTVFILFGRGPWSSRAFNREAHETNAPTMGLQYVREDHRKVLPKTLRDFSACSLLIPPPPPPALVLPSSTCSTRASMCSRHFTAVVTTAKKRTVLIKYHTYVSFIFCMVLQIQCVKGLDSLPFESLFLTQFFSCLQFTILGISRSA